MVQGQASANTASLFHSSQKVPLYSLGFTDEAVEAQTGEVAVQGHVTQLAGNNRVRE